MTQENKQARSGSGFVPSTGEEEYLKSPTEKKQALVASLAELKIAINSTFATGISFAQKATVEMIKCGKYLCDAREQFTSDTKFGEWRKKNIEFSQSHAARLMSVAREFGDNEDALLLPIGTLAELLPASPALKQQVIAEAKSGDKPTRAEVTKRKKEEQVRDGGSVTEEEIKHLKAKAKEEAEDSPPEGDTAPKPVRSDKKPGKVKEFKPWEIAQETLQKPFEERLREVEVRGKGGDEIYGSMLIFGIPPYHDGAPSLDLIHRSYDGYYRDAGTEFWEENPDLEDRFLVAYDTLTGLY